MVLRRASTVVSCAEYATYNMSLRSMSASSLNEWDVHFLSLVLFVPSIEHVHLRSATFEIVSRRTPGV